MLISFPAVLLTLLLICPDMSARKIEMECKIAQRVVLAAHNWSHYFFTRLEFTNCIIQ